MQARNNLLPPTYAPAWIIFGFFSTYSSLCLKVLKCHPPPSFTFTTHIQLLLFGVSRHTCPWCHVFQEMTALKYRLSKNNKQSEPEYLPCVHSSKHHCWLMLVKQYAYVTDWMQVTSPFMVREFVSAVWDVMMCIFIILWSM